MKSTPTDHALAVSKAALNAVPIIGGSLASLLGDYVPTSRQQATEKAVELLAEKVAAIESRINPETIDREGFATCSGNSKRWRRKPIVRRSCVPPPTYWPTRCCRQAIRTRAPLRS